jgi:hypothetical protein
LDVHECVCGAVLAEQYVFGLAEPEYMPLFFPVGLQAATSNPTHLFRPSRSKRKARAAQAPEPNILDAALPLQIRSYGLYTRREPPWLPGGENLVGNSEKYTVKCACGRVCEVRRAG